MAQFRIVNGKPTFEGIAKANLKDMVTSCAEYSMIACLHLHSLDEALAGSLALIPSLAHRIETITCRQCEALEIIAISLLTQDMRLREDMISQVYRNIVVSLVEDVAHHESKRQGIMAQEGFLDSTREIPTPILDLGIAKVASTHQL